jgi:sugar transferase (PEP-CTERM/EpsH1 system associated)
LIKHLAARHALTMLSFADEGQTPHAPELRAACRRIIVVSAPRRSRANRLRTLLSPKPDLAQRLWSPDMARALGDALNETRFDFVHVEGLEMAPYIPTLLSREPRPKIVYDAHNAEAVIQRRAFATDLRLSQPTRWPAALYSWLQIPRLQAFEAEVCRQADAVICVSSEDAAALQQLAPDLQPLIVPNGLEVEAFREHARDERNASSSPQLVFTGKMDYRPNLDAAEWFADRIFPRIRAARPEAQFVVVGQKPPEALRKRDGRNNVAVTGAVEDTRPFIAGSAVYVAPLRMGGGTRFKLLEAMALARPIVSTSLGAEGFRVQSGRELWLADTPADFAEAVLALLADPERAKAMGEAGLAFVRAHYDWSVIIPRLEEVYER